MSTLGTLAVESAELTLPRFGCAHADVLCTGGALPAVGAEITLTVADLAVVMTVLRADYDAADHPHVVLQGGVGWTRSVATPLSLQSDAGVRLATVITELAKAAGETVEQPTDAAIGTYWELVAARPAEDVRYRDALNALERAGAITGWRVDVDGVTRFGARVGVEVTARATRLRNNTTSGVTTFGTESPLAFVPGNVINGEVIGRSVIRQKPGTLEVDVYVADATVAPAMRTSVQRIVLELFGEAVRTYLVAAVKSDKRLDLVPPTDAPHLPEMANVEQWTLGGAAVTPAVGTQVLVAFRDFQARTRPIVIAFGPGTPTASSVDASDTLTIGASANEVDAASGQLVGVGTENRRVVCYGDSVTIPVVGAAAVGALLQNPASAPNFISRLRGR